MRVLAPAKINLHLRVAPPRGDGFHPILSWMCAVGLFDTLEIEQTAGGQVHLACDTITVPCDQSNLAVKAAVALADSVAKSGRGSATTDFGVSIALQKRIPSGAGLGGGSSDGARVLLALNRLWKTGLSVQELMPIAARLGSDLPFFLWLPSAVCMGRGEIVRSVPPPSAKFALLAMPDISLPTPAVYARFDQMRLGVPKAIVTEPEWRRWADLPALELLSVLVNDLEPAAFSLRPDLEELRRDLEQLTGRVVRMSGSGSSLFTLFDTEAEALRAGSPIHARTGVNWLVAPVAPMIDDDLNVPWSNW